ncbi:uncharacterized protein Z518_01828 [Rhinocladiella mackenziei CBS 650.93]|uniref:Mitochondrial division protein 1 n=1 Tax=Rhinocladiella mackenziei CBS 650.93 TaxID=1442369 RepID=A0A0D2JDC2_9EURO|nr:uncharacterized protein Z518_01828 [Rhinocladiella mackenziei CBS 650.93]KIX07175.1 hypothetical protein Z518_01828 [Rhinocladiella mackenziei CBS 650.93]
MSGLPVRPVQLSLSERFPVGNVAVNADPVHGKPTKLVYGLPARAASDADTILDLWSRLPQIKPIRLRLFLTSRPDLPIQLGFKNMSVDAHQDLVLHDEVPPTTIQHDISAFLKDAFSKIRENYNADLPSSTPLEDDWPGDKVLQALVDMAVPLFIVAATVCRYVGDLNWNPQEPLEDILKSQGTGRLDQMEQTYLPVLTQLTTTLSNSHDKEKLYQEFRLTLLLNRFPWQLLSGSNGLRENLCDLDYPGQPRRELDSIIINERLSPAFQYACRYWVHHVQRSMVPIHDDDEVHKFLRKHFLHWLEALSLINRIAEVIVYISAWQSSVSENDSTQLFSFLEDARRFVFANRYIADPAPLQVYSSAVMQKSIVRNVCGQIRAWIQTYPITPTMWSPELQKLEGHTDLVRAVAFSPDGSLLASGSDNYTVRLWNPTTGQELRKFENVPETSTISLTIDNSIVLTNRGAISVDSGSCPHLALESSTRNTITINKEWVQWNNRNLLWLPQEYCSDCLAFYGNMFAIGRHSGQVNFIQVDVA